MKTYTPEETQREIDFIRQMSRFDMCALWRTAPTGHPYFDDRLPFFDVFNRRFKELGGFSPEISKALG